MVRKESKIKTQTQIRDIRRRNEICGNESSDHDVKETVRNKHTPETRELTCTMTITKIRMDPVPPEADHEVILNQNAIFSFRTSFIELVCQRDIILFSYGDNEMS